jgi:hypothetical protein
MRTVLLFISLFISKIISAQEKNVGDFYKVTVFDQIDVTLIQSTENKVILNGPSSDEVELINKNGELKIRLPLAKMLSGDDISAVVYYSKLTAVEANEGSRISSEDIVTSEDFNLITKEGAVMDLTLDVKNLVVKMNDGSKVKLKGKALSQDILINSGSEYIADKLESNTVIITANAGAEGSVRAFDLVDAKCRAGGKIQIYGNPRRINEKIIAGGKIYEKKD